MTANKTCLVAVMPKPHAPIEQREIALPELELDSALLRVAYSEVCGTDVHLRDGRLAGVPYPIIPGHVSVGVLQEIRGTITDIEGRPFQVGDRVTFLDVHRTCHRCWHCLVAKASTRCPNRKVYGITYGLADGLTGGWAQYIYLKPGVRCLRMDGVSDELYMAGGCSLPTALHAVERADIRFADTVLVLGSGPVGLSAIALATLRGAGQVLCIGAPPDRLVAAKRMGACETLDFTTCDERERLDWVLGHTRGRGADVTIECTGVPDAVTQSMRFTCDAGTVVVVGQYTDHGDTQFNPHLDLNKKHLNVRGCWGSDFSHFYRALEVLRLPDAYKKWGSLTLDRYPLRDAGRALDTVASGKAIKTLIIPNP